MALTTTVMQPLPHRYTATASADDGGDVILTSGSLSNLRSAPPEEFGGPGTLWSPETLLTAAVADCYVLTFRAVAAGSGLHWTSITCSAESLLERVERSTQFTRVALTVRLQVPSERDTALAARVLTRAEHTCLVGNSIKAAVLLQSHVSVQA